MHNIRLAGILRFISLIIIFLIVFLYIMLNTLIDDSIFKSNDTPSGKKYEYRTGSAGISVPEFAYNTKSLFPDQLIPKTAEIKIVSRPAAPVVIPSFQFIGMIETEKKIIYSFRNMDTNKLLLFEKGLVLNGITLVSEEEKKYIFRKNGVEFQVDKK